MKKKLIVGLIIVLIPIIVAGVLIGRNAIFMSKYNSFIDNPASKESKEIEIRVRPGSSSGEIVTQLYNKRLITDLSLSKYYLKTEKIDTKLKPGIYNFNTTMTPKEIFEKLVKGEDTIKVTIPEGYTVEQIADTLIKKGIISDKESFMNEVNNGSFEYDFVKSIHESRPSRLEGYLFPATYDFTKNMSNHEIINKMLQKFKAVYDKLPQGQGKASGKSIDEIVNIASLIQTEAVVDKEMPIVSGVIYNRLEDKMLLQVDATVQYALPERKEELSIKDTKYESPYNTYLHKGLPIGPISCPGEKQLMAALMPEDNEFVYYVTKKDGTREHYFAKTYKEHQANIAKSKKN